MKIPWPHVFAFLLLLGPSTGEAGNVAYPVAPWALAADVTDDLTDADGVSRWTGAMLGSATGLQAVKVIEGKIGGPLGVGSPAVFAVDFPAPGADLDFGFRDYVDVDLQVPAGFKGKVFLDFAAEATKEAGGLSRIVLPSDGIKLDGRLHRYRVDVGLVPRWRGFLTRLALVVEAESGTQGGVAVGRILVGDLPGDVVEPNLELNLKPEMKIGNLRKVESKHGCTWWDPAHEKEGFDPAVMPRRALRMLEETWQVAVKKLGYRDPCLGMDPKSKRRRKINHITWYEGFWMSGGDPPHLNIQAGGLHDETWGNPMPHEFAHTVQAGQLDFLNGAHWESHADFVRFCRNFHFQEFTGLDCLDFGVLLRSQYYQDHPRLIYADYRPYFYLDHDPDHLGFGPGLTAKLWRTGVKDEYLWDRLPKLLPPGVTREQVAAGMARSWLTFDFPAGEHFKKALFSDDEAGRIRWYRYMTPLVPAGGRPDWWAVPLAKAPMKFGWCCHELDAAGPVVQARLEGIDIAGSGEDWRWGFVSLKKDGGFAVSPIFKPGPGSFDVPADSAKLVLFVTATPSDGRLTYAKPTPEMAVDRDPLLRRYPYEITFRNAKPRDCVFPVENGDGAAHPNGGGFVARTAKVERSAYVGKDARVLGEAHVLDRARILDRAVVRGNAVVRDEAEVSGAAVVSGNAEVSGGARVRNFAFIDGGVKIRERARVGDMAVLEENQDISGDAWLRGVTAPFGDSQVGGHAILDADYAMGFKVDDGVHFHHIPWGEWYAETALKLTKPRGLVAGHAFKDTDGAQAMDEFGALVSTVRGSETKTPYLTLDSSLVDAPAATWMIRAQLRDAKAQPLFSINDTAREGLVMGIGGQGRLVLVLSRLGEAPVVVASEGAVPSGAPVTLVLRMDGKTVDLFLNGRSVASRAWEVSPQRYFRDLTAAEPTSVYLGRDAKGNACRAALLGFRAYNIALTESEIEVLR